MSNEKPTEAERRQFWVECMSRVMPIMVPDYIGIASDQELAHDAAEYADAALAEYDARWGK